MTDQPSLFDPPPKAAPKPAPKPRRKPPAPTYVGACPCDHNRDPAGDWFAQLRNRGV